MIENTYGEKGGVCWSVPCGSVTTHELVTLVPATETMEEIEQHTWYCLDHALYFYAWLPYVYGQTVVSLSPPWTQFREAWMKG